MRQFRDWRPTANSCRRPFFESVTNLPTDWERWRPNWSSSPNRTENSWWRPFKTICCCWNTICSPRMKSLNTTINQPMTTYCMPLWVLQHYCEMSKPPFGKLATRRPKKLPMPPSSWPDSFCFPYRIYLLI